RTADQPEKELSTLKYGYNPDFVPLFPLEEPVPGFRLRGDKAFLVHEKSFELAQDVLVSAGAKPEEKTLQLTIKLWTVGPDGNGAWEEHTFTRPVEVGGNATELTEQTRQRLANKDEITAVPGPDEVDDPAGAGEDQDK